MFFKTLNDASLAVVALANMGREKVIAAEMMDYQPCAPFKALKTYLNSFVRCLKVQVQSCSKLKAIPKKL